MSRTARSSEYRQVHPGTRLDASLFTNLDGATSRNTPNAVSARSALTVDSG